VTIHRREKKNDWFGAVFTAAEGEQEKLARSPIASSTVVFVMPGRSD